MRTTALRSSGSRFPFAASVVVGALVAGALALVPSTVTSAVGNTYTVACGDNAGLVTTLNLGNQQVGGIATIELAANCTYTIASAASGSNAFQPINDNNGATTIIDGNGATIQRTLGAGGPRFRFFDIGLSGNVTINDLTLTGGEGNDGAESSSPTPGDAGGAIYSEGNLVLNDVTVTGNQTGNGGSGSNTSGTNGNAGAPGGAGGAIYNSETGSLTITDSTISNNHTGQGGGGGNASINGGSGGASGDGAGIYSLGGLSMTGSTVNGNSTGAPGVGGSAADSGSSGGRGSGAGIAMRGYGLITSDLIENNSTGGYGAWGGGISMPASNGSAYTITNDTFVNNVAWRAGALYAASDVVNVSNSTFTGNTANGTGDEITGDVAAMDYGATMTFANTLMYQNGSPNTVDCNTAAYGDQVTYTSLGGLMSDSADYCGTNTVAIPQLAALASNGGPTQTEALASNSPAINAGVSTYCAATDQRGVPRPQGSSCDIGAYEYASTPGSGTISGSTATLTGVARAYSSNVAGTSLYYTWSVSGVTSSITGNGTNSPQITFTSVGTATVTLTVGAHNAVDSQATETLAVAVGPSNDPGPTLSLSSATKTVNEGSTQNFTFTASHPSGYTFAYVSGFPDCGAGATLESHTVTSTGGSFGCYYPHGGVSLAARVQLVDQYGVSTAVATEPVTVAVVAPRISITGNATPNEGATSTYSYTLFTPGDETLTATTSCTGRSSKVVGSDTFTGTFTNFSGTFQCLTPNGPASASANVTSGTGSASYAISVVNVAPTVSISGPSPVAENGNTTGTYQYSLNTRDPGDELTLALVPGSASCGGPGIGTVVSATVIAITCRFDAGPSTADVSGQVVDPDGATSTGGDFAVTVDNVAPTVSFPEPTGSVPEGSTVIHHFTATDPGLETLTATLPAGCTASGSFLSTPGSLSGAVSCSYPDGPTSTDRTIIVSDGTTTTSATLTQQVTDVAPTISASLGAIEGFVGDVIPVDIGDITDPGQDTVTEWIVHWGDGQTDTYTSAPGQLTHDFIRQGNLSVTIDLVDEDGTHVNVGPPLTILMHDSAAQVVMDSTPGTVLVGTTTTFTFTINDEDPDVTFTFESADCGINESNTITYNIVSNENIDGRTGSFDCTWTAGNVDPQVSVFVTSAPGVYFSVHVADVLPAIVWDEANPTTVTEGSYQVEYDFTLSSWVPGQFNYLDSSASCGADASVVSKALIPGTNSGYVICDFPTYSTGPGTLGPTIGVGNSEMVVTTAHEDVTVLNVPPVVTFDALPSSSVDEGSIVHYSYTTYDPGSETVSVVGSPDCGTGGILQSNDFDVFSCLYPDGPSSATASLTVTDGSLTDGTVITSAPAVVIDNVAPTSTLIGSGQHQFGTPYQLAFGAVTDPGQDTVSTWTVHWGDGSSDTYTSANATPTHTYTTGFTDDISLDLTDEDGTYSDVADLVTGVPDVVAPVIHLTGPYTVEAAGPAGSPVDWVPPTATDDRDGTDPVVCGSANDFPGQTYPVGETKINCVAHDAAGNYDENEYLVIDVVDTTPPVVTPPVDVSAEATDASGAFVGYGTATASDIVDGTDAASCSPSWLTEFPLGSTTVTCSATDSHSNTGTATFTVTVVDTTGPVLTVPSTLTVNATSGAGADVTYSATSADAVDGPVAPTCSPASGSLFARATTTTVICDATDSSGNSSSAQFTVTVAGVILSQDASSGDMLAEVSDTSGFAPGDYAFIDPGQPDSEVRYIASIHSLDFAAPLASAHPLGTLVTAIAPPGGDVTAPAIAITEPTAAQQVVKGASVTAQFRCSDAGVGVQQCLGGIASGAALDTSSLGVHTVTVRAWDFNGNASTASVSYTVIAAPISPLSIRGLSFTGGTIPWWLVGLAVVLVVLGALAFVIGRRRRRREDA